MLVSCNWLLTYGSWPLVLTADYFLLIYAYRHDHQRVLGLTPGILATKEIHTLQLDVVLCYTPVYLVCESLICNHAWIALQWTLLKS